MKILVVGGGGREHALCWALNNSNKVTKIYCAPGNAGISEIAECVNIGAEDIENLCKFAKENSIDLTVVGPEAPLVKGIVDIFNENGLKIFGADKKGAQLEGSKVFAKEFFKKYNIPSADFKIFDNADEALKYAEAIEYPKVFKADGLAAGKGVIVAKTKDEGIEAIKKIMIDKKFGDAGNRMVIEDFLEGEEASFIAVLDGKTFIPFDSSQDHKPVFDNDEGPNTGGMGAYSPAPVVNETVFNKIIEKVLIPTINGLKNEGIEYKGVLYAGLMIKDNEPYVLEYNCRFGDPETQPLLVRLDYDFCEIIENAIDGNLEEIKDNVKWKDEAAVCVVMASGGYPESYKKGYEIKGLDEVKNMENVVVFHAGTKKEGNKIVTSGGRVLGVTALGKTIPEAIENAYKAVSKISWTDVHYRKDIGKKALKYL